MNIQDKLKEANLSGDTKVTLVFSDGEDVVHAWDGYEEQVVENTGIAKHLAELVTDPNFKNNDILHEMRSYGRSTEHYDYKRGFTTVEARVDTTVEEVLNANPGSVTGWEVEVETTLGNTTIKGG